MAALLVCLFVLLVVGGLERLARDRAWRAIPTRIHVNGTRAKSTVTRLIWSALVEAGIPAAAKTTGTAPRMLLPDGREEPVRRRAPANIREQLAFLRRARRAGARAVVVECMAIEPALQAASEQDMVRATIGVVTNVRFDHAEVMGWSLAAIAESLASTVPTGGVLVTGAAEMAPRLAERAAARGSRLVIADVEGCGPARQNEAVAIAVTRELGIDDAVARRGFARAPRDPGAAGRGTVDLPGGPTGWLDATAANDPESLGQLLASEAGWSGHGAILIYNHRDDRAARLATFAERADSFRRADRLVVTGATIPWTLRRRLARLDRARPVSVIARRDLPAWIRANGPGAFLAFCGNTRGFDVARLLEEAASRD
jgi:poly-gamma-glutamate synthase PgsB/CapB